MIDPAHGGTESGAVLNPTLLEKDVTLALARRLRQDLTSRGIVSELVRDADVNLSTDDRAGKVNSGHVVLYLCLHASSEVGGIRIFSAMLPQAENTNIPFLDWNTAQAESLPNARSVQQQLVAAIQKSGLPVRSLTAPLRPLNNVVAPAIAVEVGPTSANVTQLMLSDFQAAISTALTNGLAASVRELESSAPGAPR
ncbi:MAG TPA: N-acetylmuramoyl-L-alanine amidase [Terriglobales bacterium]|nr:N-acetylmuramoyl-L-alanine amidase [Terriglobales bacterium]